MVHMDYCGQTSPDCSGAPAITVSLTQHQRDTTVRTVVGAVDWNTRPLVRSAFIEAGCDGSLHPVIDLFAITSMDSAGPYMLLEARVKHRVSGGGHLAVITYPSSRAIPDLPSVAMRAAFDVHSTLTDAFHACAYADTRSSHRSPETTSRQTSLADSASTALNSRSVQQALAPTVAAL
jgi:anti-anti-sigma regulatory factor